MVASDHSNPYMLLYTKGKIKVVDSVVRGNTDDNANGCQMMNCTYVKTDLNRDEHLNLNLE